MQPQATTTNTTGRAAQHRGGTVSMSCKLRPGRSMSVWRLFAPGELPVFRTAAIAVCVTVAVALGGGRCRMARAGEPLPDQPQAAAKANPAARYAGTSNVAADREAAQDQMLLPVDGPPLRAELRSVDKQWQLEFAGQQGGKTINAADIIQWGRPAEPAAGPLMVLADGSLIVAEPLGVENEALRFDSAVFGQQSLPLEVLAAVAFKTPVDRLQRDLFVDRLLGASLRSDLLILANGDELSGVLQSLSEQAVEFRAEFGPLKLDRARLAAIILNPTLRRTIKRPSLCAVVGFADGTRVLAGSMELKDQRAQVALVAGAAFAAEAKQLVCLVPLGGRAVYLSELEPLEFEHTPFLDLKWPYRKDRNVLGGMLRSGGQLYLKGLGVHSAARLVYALERPYQRFQTELALDDCAGRQGSVVYRILLDGKQKYVSPVLRGGDQPLSVSVPLEGAKRLELVVDYADRADVLDRANWLRARLIK